MIAKPQQKATTQQAKELLNVGNNTQRIYLNPTEWKNAIKLLDNPPQANENMKALLTRGYGVINQ